jgi:hypothetical protein
MSCSKNGDQLASNNTTSSQNKPESCLFGQSDFNLSKRAALNEEVLAKGKPIGGGGTGSTGGGGTVSTGTSVLLIDFDGHNVSGTSWNWNGDFSVAPANLSYAAMTTIVDRVANDFSPFNVIVTTDESVFNSVAASKRMRVVLTESWEWFGQAGGTSFVGSFGQTNNTPCFVFTSLLNYNEKAIGEATSHELGHTMGLEHQATYSGTTLTSQYNYGTGSGETGWAPIMGCGYYQNLTTWTNGQTAQGSTVYQDNLSIIASKLGYVSDDYSNSTSGAAALASSLSGKINTSSDVDFFAVNTATTKTLSVTPFNVAAGNNGANIDVKLNIYSSNGQLIITVNDPSVLDATTVLNPGQYYISVSSNANSYTSTYGMLGKYTISLN